MIESFEAWLNQHALLAQLGTTIVGSLATFFAVVVAGLTASATRETVREMRETRLQSVRPVLYISARRRGFQIAFSPTDSLYPKAKFLNEEKEEVLPFEVRNAVPSPAFDVKCRWRLGLGSELPEQFKLALLNQAAERKGKVVKYGQGKIVIHDVGDDDEMSWLNVEWDYSSQGLSDLKEILGDSAKLTDLPRSIWNQVICLALVSLERRQLYNEPFERVEIPLSVEIACASPSGEGITKAFDFKLSIWWAAIKGDDDKYLSPGSLPSTWKLIEFNGSLESVSKPQIVLVNPTINDLWKAVAQEVFSVLKRAL
jgi:hypothetical protein